MDKAEEKSTSWWSSGAAREKESTSGSLVRGGATPPRPAVRATSPCEGRLVVRPRGRGRELGEEERKEREKKRGAERREREGFPEMETLITQLSYLYLFPKSETNFRH